MPTVQPPMPSTAPAPAPTAPPSIPSPGSPHHGLPRNFPAPQPAPQPRPMPGPASVVTVIAIATAQIVCPVGARTVARRKPPIKGDSRPVRRQRPCRGTGKPTRERDGFRRRRIGRFRVSKANGIAFREAALILEVEAKTREAARLSGYDVRSHRANIRIVSELDRPRTWREKVIDSLDPSGVCWYQVWAVEPRWKCRCPDGSPCRRTVRD